MHHKQGHLGMWFLCLPNIVAPSASMCSPHSAARCTVTMPRLSGPPWHHVNPACCGSLCSQKGIRLLVFGKFCCPNFIASHCAFHSRAQGWFKELAVLAQSLRTSQNVDPCTKPQNLPEATHVPRVVSMPHLPAGWWSWFLSTPT